jgi:excisionase family DNA binding protein
MPDDDLLTVPEVAAILRLNEQTVRKWLREGRLPGIYLGSRTAGYRIRRSDVTAFLEAQRGEGAAA